MCKKLGSRAGFLVYDKPFDFGIRVVDDRSF